MIFKAYSLTNEIDLNKIASKCNIPKKYTWEEPLILEGPTLAAILNRDVDEKTRIMIFSFGSIVMINTISQDAQAIYNYLKTVKPDLPPNFTKYTDDYELREAGEPTNDEDGELYFTDQYAIVPKIQPYHAELVAVVIAKSVALERIEEQAEKILDKVEGLIDRLDKANLRLSDKELARTTAQIIRHEYNTIAYIMILDKPDITWIRSDAEKFYDRMSHFFELNDRYEIIRQKTEILNVITGHFASISHSLRGLFVEWLIVILIVVEVILMVADLIKPH